MSQEVIEGIAEVDVDDVIDDVAPVVYTMASWGADYALETVVQRLTKGIIFVPPFQRSYVWTITQASRFIESLLLGLPVPGVFLYKEEDTGKLLIVDGQQRLQSVRRFFDGVFDDKVFALQGVVPELEGKTYKTLSEERRNNLNDTVLHATIVKQEEPKGDRGSIYQIFERLNSGGTQLQPQEIRSCIYYGRFVDMVHDLNKEPDWRKVYGGVSQRAKDQELILRFFAFEKNLSEYKRPLSYFLNGFLLNNRNPSEAEVAAFKLKFNTSIQYFSRVLGKSAFRPKSSLNAAVFDSMMVGVSSAVSTGRTFSDEEFRSRYNALISDTSYLEACARATGDLGNVTIRMTKALAIFAN